MSKKPKPKLSKYQSSTMAALLEEKPKRGRPRHTVSRQNVYVALSPEEKVLMKDLIQFLPETLKRADLADLAVTALNTQLEALRRAVAGRSREIPEGVTDLESLYLLWDLPLPKETGEEKWTSIRVSPQQVIEFGRAHGALKAAFGASRSQTFSLALALLQQYLSVGSLQGTEMSLAEVRELMTAGTA
jgi:hypothetical protein